jgi:hypothetical protein
MSWLTGLLGAAGLLAGTHMHATSLQDDGPQQASCTLIAEGEDAERRGPDSFRAECPADLPGLQQAADGALAALDLDIRPMRYQTLAFADAIHFQNTGTGWTPLPGQRVVGSGMQMPMRPVVRGVLHMLCAFAIEPDPNGRPENVVVECLADRSGDKRQLERAARRGVQVWRYLPVALTYCIDEQTHDVAQRIMRTPGQPQYVEPTPPMPDPSRLPSLCSQE